MKSTLSLITLLAVSFGLVACGKQTTTDQTQEEVDNTPAIETRNACERYYTFMDCYVAGASEADKEKLTLDYETMKTQLSEKSFEESNQLCTTFLLTLEENRSEVETETCKL